MKGIISWLVVATLLFLFIFLISWNSKNKAISKVASTDDKNVEISNENLPNLSPSAVVELYINSSIKGDEESVKSLTTFVPDSYSTECVRIHKEDSGDTENTSTIAVPVENENRVEMGSNVSNETGNTDKFVKLVDPQSKNSIAFIEARYVFATQVAFKGIRILKTNIYRDEASVELEYIISDSFSRKSKYLLINTDGWKVFSTESLDHKALYGNKYYAQERPLCN